MVGRWVSSLSGNETALVSFSFRNRDARVCTQRDPPQSRASRSRLAAAAYYLRIRVDNEHRFPHT